MKKLLCLVGLYLLVGCAAIDPNRMDTVDGKFIGKVTVSDYSLAPNWNTSWKTMTECEPQLESKKYHWVRQTEETSIRQHGKLKYFHEAVIEAAHANLIMGRNVSLIRAINEQGLADDTIGQALIYLYYKDTKDPKIIGIQTRLNTNHPNIHAAFEYLNVLEAVEIDEGLKIVRENIPAEEALNKHRAYITWRMNGGK
jgi:hypothetical protein